VDYSQNRETRFSEYFVKPPGKPDQVYYSEMDLSIPQKLRAASNAIYSVEAKRKLEKLIRDERPDIIQTLQIHTVLSYSLIDAAKKYDIPIVCRMSNYQLMCPAEHFLRENEPCEECMDSLFCAIKHRCVQGSLAASSLRTASLWFHNVKGTFDKVDYFIVPSLFLRSKMLEKGYPESRVMHVPSFLNTDAFEPSFEPEDYIVYFGRIAIEKGVPDLIKAFHRIDTKKKLILVGNYENPEGARVMKLIENYSNRNIEFVGYQSLPEIKRIVRKALFTICPSIWYENTPNNIYESFALGTPVIASRLGSMQEQVEDGRTGLLFESGNVDDLRSKLEYLLKNVSEAIRMGKNARVHVEHHHSAEMHYNRLKLIFDKITSGKTAEREVC
jgi:glycosyltransferase involved in cell wall biosynthesis